MRFFEVCRDRGSDCGTACIDVARMRHLPISVDNISCFLAIWFWGVVGVIRTVTIVRRGTHVWVRVLFFHIEFLDRNYLHRFVREIDLAGVWAGLRKSSAHRDSTGPSPICDAIDFHLAEAILAYFLLFSPQRQD